MKYIRNFLVKYSHIWVFLYGLIYFPWFTYLEKNVTNDFHIIHMAIDDSIPFVEYFVVPYFLWFGYVAAAVAYFFFKNKYDFYRLCGFLAAGMTIFLVISTIYPNGHTLRPESFAHDNIFTQAVAWLYATDTPTNLFPSIHVYNSLGVHIAVTKSECFREKKKTKFVSLLLCVSIILSTMFLKQHSFFDVITAFAMAGIFFCLIYMKSPAAEESYEKQFHHI